MTLIGLGMGATFSTIYDTAIGDIDPAEAGSASGRRGHRQRSGLRFRPALPGVLAAVAAARCPAAERTQVQIRGHHLDGAAGHPRRAALRAPDGDSSGAAAEPRPFVAYNRVTNQPLLAIEVDGFAFHENKPEQRERDALKEEILAARQMPLLRLATTGSREPQRIRRELDDAEAHWARLSTR
jgi:hypothetical protein